MYVYFIKFLARLSHVNFMYTFSIEGFHCHTMIKAIQQIKSRIKEVKEDEHSNCLAKIQVCEIFRAGDIRRNVLLKFITLCMETPCLCPSKGTNMAAGS